MTEAFINSKSGIHARPAGAIVGITGRFKGEVFFLKGDNRYNAKSIMNIMSMGLQFKDKITIEALGEGGELVEAELKNIFEGMDA